MDSATHSTASTCGLAANAEKYNTFLIACGTHFFRDVFDERLMFAARCVALRHGMMETPRWKRF